MQEKNLSPVLIKINDRKIYYACVSSSMKTEWEITLECFGVIKKSNK